MNIEVKKEIPLNGTDGGKIFVSVIEAPYNNNQKVASIAVSLKGTVDQLDWKVHIPLTNIDEVCEALNSLK